MGIYVHVPFCRSKCFYCGFYSVASLTWKEAYIDAIEREILLRRDYLPGRESGTLYFGGGTPSFLSAGELRRIVEALERCYTILPGAERTIELNPEDLTRQCLTGIREMGFNRLSVGVQTFSDHHLKQINRTHTGKQAIDGIRLAAEMGFDNIGVDLILGLPGQTREELSRDLDRLHDLPVKHVSVYMLSIDPNTVFEARVKQGKFKMESEEEVAHRYLKVCEQLKNRGFEHYEISNFAREGRYSIHNTSYWQQVPYIGFGPSAHSYDLHSRQWNTANLKVYIDHLNNGALSFEREELTDVDLYNEHVMTNLRTTWGVERSAMECRFGAFWGQVQVSLQKYLDSGDLVERDGRIRISESGWVISDAILSDLFVV